VALNRITKRHLLCEITMLPATWHRWTRLVSTPGRQAGARFTRPSWLSC